MDDQVRDDFVNKIATALAEAMAEAFEKMRSDDQRALIPEGGITMEPPGNIADLMQQLPANQQVNPNQPLGLHKDDGEDHIQRLPMPIQDANPPGVNMPASAPAPEEPPEPQPQAAPLEFAQGDAIPLGMPPIEAPAEGQGMPQIIDDNPPPAAPEPPQVDAPVPPETLPQGGPEDTSGATEDTGQAIDSLGERMIQMNREVERLVEQMVRSIEDHRRRINMLESSLERDRGYY